jgi:hypothetical protein
LMIFIVAYNKINTKHLQKQENNKIRIAPYKKENVTHWWCI